MAQFNYTPLRNTAISLVKQFGQPVPLSILRNVNDTPDDANKPWRGGDPSIKQFNFTGVANTLGISKRGAYADADKSIIVPGDIVSTTAVGDPATVCGFPTITDRVLLGTTNYAIVGIEDITPGDLPMIFKIYARAWPTLVSQPADPF